ncbi:MAG: NIPSNAP family protein [Balneolaceae bacterium]|nr:MAG: NIPSNAP family protein [Balneolaceae bacterium]
MKQALTILISSFLFFASVLMLNFSPDSGEQLIESNTDKVYELRTYTTHDGRLEALHRRFEDHTLRLFEKHGMTNIGYWVPSDPELRENTLIFILMHESADAARANWDAFRADPEWQQAYKDSHADGVIVAQAVSVYMNATEYSVMK